MTHGPGVPEADAIRDLAGRWLPLLGDDDFVVSPVGLWLGLGVVALDGAGELPLFIGRRSGAPARSYATTRASSRPS
ncbi:hypothetical protein ABZ318_19140 [Streptomyces sp. NPDC006197]|uniref:hypothetical protein n=1 Tax=Streptomyces sp. NPDC006197 TaxID=3156685 RepID=UPI0033A2BFEA